MGVGCGKFYKLKVEGVLRELIADERLEGCQHFAFKEYKRQGGGVSGHVMQMACIHSS